MEDRQSLHLNNGLNLHLMLGQALVFNSQSYQHLDLAFPICFPSQMWEPWTSKLTCYPGPIRHQPDAPWKMRLILARTILHPAVKFLIKPQNCEHWAEFTLLIPLRSGNKEVKREWEQQWVWSLADRSTPGWTDRKPRHLYPVSPSFTREERLSCTGPTTAWCHGTPSHIGQNKAHVYFNHPTQVNTHTYSFAWLCLCVTCHGLTFPDILLAHTVCACMFTLCHVVPRMWSW